MTGRPVALVPLVAAAVGVAGSERPILDGVSLTVHAGQMLAVSGASGSGKTTLLAVLGGLLHPDSGSVWFDGLPIAVDDWALRRRTGMVLQLYGLIPVLTARENVEVALQARGLSGAAVQIRTEAVLERLGLADTTDRLVDQISGGQQQRVAVARALVIEPALLLADEPTAELDSTNRDRVMAQLRAEADHGAVVVVATHDDDVAAVCDAELHLVDGRMAAGGRV